MQNHNHEFCDKVATLLVKLEENLKTCNKQLAKLPKGSLLIKKKGNHFEYYHVIDGKRKYIRVNQLDYISKLATATYINNYKRYLNDEIAALKAYLKKRNPKIPAPATYLEEHPAISELVANKIFKGPKNLVDWANMPYEQSDFYKEDLGSRASQGHYVRSKSECVIANALFFKKIPYRYEMELHIGDKIYRPDFVFYNSKGEMIIWEHLGLLGDEKYLKRTLQKIEDYIKAGYYPGVNLILTADEKAGTIIDSQVVDSLIDIYYNK